MPEGPEIRRMADQLGPLLLGKQLTGVEVLSGRYVRHADTFKAPTLPAKVIGVAATGKLLCWTFEGDQYLMASMAMTGRWTNSTDPYNRVKFTFSDSSVLYFNDIRNFGTVSFGNGQEVSKRVNALGLDLLGQDGIRYRAQNQDFLDYCKGFKGLIGELLLNQGFLAGVGNYIRAEALYRAKLSPHRLLASLSDTELTTLRDAVIDVMSESYKAGGATILTYRGIDGGLGLFTGQFQVYGRKVDPLGNSVTREIDRSKRAIWWVPAVQV